MSVLVEHDVKRTLFSMAFPMLAGTFAMNAYSLTDAWFVSQLGTLPLAAMGYIFPVVMLLTCVAGGLGGGVTPLVSHAIGKHDHQRAARLVTHGIMLVVAVTVLIAAMGWLGTGALFSLLGADEHTMPFIDSYMRIWYLGAIFMSLPMMGNGVLISMGDSRSASAFLLIGTLVNAILNPFLIYGWAGLPAMGIAGSALATVIAQAISTAWLFHRLYFKHKLLCLGEQAKACWALAELLDSSKHIMVFAIPGILSMILMPISASVVTGLLGRFGHEAVAACGAAGRVEMLAFVIPMALGMSLTPFISQNYGAGRIDRICEARTLSIRFALLYCGGVTAIFFLGAPWISTFFTEDAKVAEIMVMYIRIISIGYGMMEVHRYCTFFLTGLHQPKASTALNAIRVLCFLIPLSFLGAYLDGVRGVFIGRLATDMLVGSLGIWWAKRACQNCLPAVKTEEAEDPEVESPVLF